MRRPNPAGRAAKAEGEDTMIVLASASAARRRMLEQAGLEFTVDPADIDEATLREGSADRATVAAALADIKALAVSARHPGALVVGADQTLHCQAAGFDKPASQAEARVQLLALRGRSHRLVSAVAVAVDGRVEWRHTGIATLVMRDFSEAFLDSYLAAVGDAALSSVGAYQLEGRGVQLFERVDGDHFTVLGLPLLPLLAWLREHGAVPS
jgi:septum formation protein